MADHMSNLFAEYQRVSKKKEQAWNKVFATTDVKARQRLTREAEKLNTQLYGVMRKINKLADKLGVKVKKKRRA